MTIGRILMPSKVASAIPLKSTHTSWYRIEFLVCGANQTASPADLLSIALVEPATIILRTIALRMMDTCRMERKKQLTKAYQDKNMVTKLRERKS